VKKFILSSPVTRHFINKQW